MYTAYLRRCIQTVLLLIRRTIYDCPKHNAFQSRLGVLVIDVFGAILMIIFGATGSTPRVSDVSLIFNPRRDRGTIGSCSTSSSVRVVLGELSC